MSTNGDAPSPPIKGKAHAYAWVFPFIEWKLWESNPERVKPGEIAQAILTAELERSERRRHASGCSTPNTAVIGDCYNGAITGGCGSRTDR